MRGLAIRRFQDEKKRKWAHNLRTKIWRLPDNWRVSDFGSWADRNDEEKWKVWEAQRATTPKSCSCPLCSTGKRKYGGLTRQERLALMKEQEYEQEESYETN